MKAKLLRRRAYGLDQKGEVDDHQDMNLEDTSTPMSEHKTPVNKVNTTGDPEAEVQFPWLGEHTHFLPSRGRS
jgi:hypothetical protein